MIGKEFFTYRAYLVIALLVFVIAGCATSGLSAYVNNMYDGRKMLMNREYQKALDLFLKADEQQSSAAALAFAGVSCYRMGDIRGADRYLNRAQAISAESDAKWLILGYKSLVLLKQGHQDEGLKALSAYVDLYGTVEPGSRSLADLKEMLESGRINLAYLEVLLDQQVRERYIDYNKL